MKKAKKILALLLCAVLLVCATVAGTLAYLEAKTSTVTNTFVAAGGDGPFVDEGTFEIKEYQVTQDTTGKYTQTETEVEANTYSVMPNTTIPKQVFVKLSRTSTVTPAPAYLYLEVVDGLKANEYTWSVDADNWKLLGTVTTENKTSEIYQYIGNLSDDKNVLTTVSAGTKIDVITDDEVKAENVTLTAGEFKLSFNAYLAQASTGDSDAPADVFKACFGKEITPVPSTGDGE